MIESTAQSTAPIIPPGDVLITSAQLAALAGGKSQMTLWRWLREGVLPPPIIIRRRRYWPRSVALAALCNSGAGQ